MKMTKKSKKRALISSLVVMAICFTMLIGSTFAWFTDSAASTNNVITTGTLDVELTQYNAETGAYDEVTGPVFDNVLWEPNATYVEYFRVENFGSLALKFGVALNVTNVTKDLNEVLEYAVVEGTSVTGWTSGTAVAVGNNVTTIDGITLAPAGEANCYYDFALAVHMDHNAGNDYQDASITFDVNVAATQATYESDSFGDQYDAGADPVVVATAAELQNALNAGGYVQMTGNITAPSNERFTIPAGSTVTLDLNGYTLTSKDGGGANTMAIYVDNGANFTLEDSVGTGKLVASCYGVYVKQNATFVMNGGTISVSGNNVYDVAVTTWNSAFVMNGGTIEAKFAVWASNYYRDAGETGLNDCSIKIAEGCTITSTGYADVEIYDAPDAVVNVPESLVVYNGQ